MRIRYCSSDVCSSDLGTNIFDKRYDSARANTIVVRNALEDAYQALAEITGTPVDNLKALPDDFEPQLPAEGGDEDWVANAISNNPALQAKETQVQARDYDVDTDRAGHLPTLDFGGSHGKNATRGRSTVASTNPHFTRSL